MTQKDPCYIKLACQTENIYQNKSSISLATIIFLLNYQEKQSCEERTRVDREIYGETEGVQEDFTSWCEDAEYNKQVGQRWPPASPSLNLLIGGGQIKNPLLKDITFWMTITQTQSLAPSPYSAPIHMHTRSRIPKGRGVQFCSVWLNRENRGHKTQGHQTL